MKNIISIVLALLISIFSLGSAFPNDDPFIYPSDLDVLTGGKWTGNLIYLDYQSNKETMISADITVLRSNEDEYKFIFILEYPKEPDANFTDTVVISLDGSIFDGENVVEKNVFSEDSLQFITEAPGMDDYKESVFRHTYSVSPVIFSIRKDVKYSGENEFLKRNEYLFKR